MALGAVTGPALQALQAYRATQGEQGAGAAPGGVGGFGDMLQSALKGVVDQGHAADQQSMAAISGHGNLLEVVSAVSKAELSLQTTIAVRDRVVQAYQDIMRMPI
jgi:flagellar hook-basal body complex protein FliE